MRIIIVFVALLFAQTVSAAPRDLKQKVLGQKASLETKLQANVRKKAEFSKLSQFKVRFDTMECHETDNSEMSEGPIGVCFVEVGAFQVSAKYVLVIRTDEPLTATALYVHVE